MQQLKRPALVALALSTALAALPASAQKDRYPDKPVRLIVPFAPGGGIDTIGRIMAQTLTASLGQSVVVDNRAGVGGLTHLATELFDLMAGVQMTHVPYKGSGPALTDLLGGQIQVSFAAVPVTMPHVKTGRLRAIAATTARRIGAIPEIPTIAETLPGYETILWYGVLGPKGLPKDVLARWDREIAAALRNPEMRERLAAEGFETGDTGAARLRDVMKHDIAKWSKVVTKANIKVAQ